MPSLLSITPPAGHGRADADAKVLAARRSTGNSSRLKRRRCGKRELALYDQIF
jgi:hypothetical protein